MLAWLIGGGASGIITALAQAYAAKENAKTDAERIEAEKQIAVLTAQAQLQKGSVVDAIMRFLIAAPIAAFIWKVIVWDKLLSWGSTDNLSQDLWYLVYVVVGFYFVHQIVGSRNNP